MLEQFGKAIYCDHANVFYVKPRTDNMVPLVYSLECTQVNLAMSCMAIFLFSPPTRDTQVV